MSIVGRRRGLGWLGEVALDAVLAGVVVGVLEALVLARRGAASVGELPRFVVAGAGLALGPALVVGIVLGLMVRALGRHPRVAGMVAALREPGPRRVEVLAGVGVAALAAGVVWWVGFSIVAFAFGRYQAARPAAMLATSVITGTAIGAVAAAALAGPPVTRWCGRRGVLVGATRGLAGTVLAAAITAAALVGVARLAARLAPAWDPVPAALEAFALVVLLAAAIVRPSRWLGRRGMVAVGVSAALLAVGAPLVIRHDPVTRGVVVSRGVITAGALDVLAAPFDGDGDGFPDAFGMVDCDDDDDDVHPGAVELAGNHRDDDCSGGDADPGVIAARVARPSATPAAPPPDILLVTVDSLRADHTSLHGYPQPTTPVLAALAARGIRFEHAVSTAACTRFAMAGLLFGRHAHTLPFTTGEWPLLRDHQLPTLASTLGAAGYRTAAILSRDLPMSPPTYAGFAEVITVEQDRPKRNVANADAVTTRALAWLAAPAEHPRFLWIHFLDPHQPYDVRPDTARFTGATAAYDAEIARTDAAIGRLLAAVDPAHTIIAVTGDHGEAFLDHHQRFHGSTLHEEELHVPLVLAAPGLAPAVIAPTVSHLDLAPTLLDLAGVTTPAGMTGDSLVPALHGAPLAERALVATVIPTMLSRRSLVAVYHGRHKLIRDLDAWTVEVYDLATDPHEHAPIRSGPLVTRMTALLEATVTRDLSVLP